MTAISPHEVGRQMQPLAEKLEAIAQPLAGDRTPSGVLQLAPLAAQTATLVAYLLRNAGEGQLVSARHNLQILHDVAERLTTTTRAVMAECDVRLPQLHGCCIARVALDQAEVEWLSFRPYAAHQVEPAPCCALEGGHPGPHAALGQQGDRIEW